MTKKLTFLIAAAVMLLTMMATTGRMWGQTRDSYSYTFTAKQFTAYDSPVTLNGISWTASATGGDYFGYDATKGQQFGKGADPCSALTLSTSGISGTITEIKINTSGASSIAATLNVTVGGNSFGDSKSLTATATEYTFSGSASGTIAFNYTQTSSKAIYIKSITVTYSTGGSTTPSITANDVNIAYDATGGSIGYTLNNATGNVTAAVTTGDWLTLGTVTASAVPFTCSANDGAQRTATVTLSFEGAQDKVVTVTQAQGPNAPGTQNNPYTVAQARAAIDAGTGTQGVYATGIVSEIVTAYGTGGYNNVTFNMVDEAGDDEFLQAFRCVGTDAPNVLVGDIVVVTGDLTKYQSTYEFAQNCSVVSLEHPSTPYITANDVEITYDATAGSIAYTVENPVQGGQLTAATTSEWLTLSNNFASPIAFTCSANAAGERTATVTLTYTYGAKATVNKEVTVTQAANPNVFDNISSITNTDVNYKVKGTVLAVSARAFVLGDGTGYIYYYNGYSAPSVAVNDLKSVNGTMSSYGHVFQFTNAASITAAETSNYNGTPAATVITAIPDYTSGLHLSDYYQFDGTLTKSSGYYYVSCGEGNINISYPSSAQQTAMNALENKNVRVKGYFAGINSSSYFTVILESIEEIVTPTISITPATANPFTYVQGSGPSDDQVFEVAGENLTSDDIIATITTGADYFEITDDEEYSSTVTVNSGDYISVRLKAGLALGNEYAGVLTLTNEGAENVTVNLSGSVTGATYTINLDDQITGGTIEADKASAAEGETVTLTAHPDAAYTFGSWTVYQDDLSTEVTVTDNQFTMPACEVYVTATFNTKPTYTITCVADPNEGGMLVSSPASAYEGQTVTLSYVAETGYSLSGIVITKTEDSSATGITPTASGDDFTFTMPGYAVTATATFLSETYTGSFVLFTEEMTEGDYVLVYEGQAMTNTVTSNKFDVTDVIPSGSIITSPSRNIVWHIAPSTTTGYWTIKNEKVNKYANSSSATSTNVSLVDTPYDGAKWIASGTDTHDFRPKINEGQSTVRYLRKDARFGTYASTNGGPLTLYKYTVLTERTITFHGNGGLYQGDETYTQVVYDGIATNLTANQFTLANSAFAGWALTEDGDVAYADGASITVTDNNLDLYAKWVTSYTAMVDDAIVGGTVLVNGEEIVEVAEGTEMTLTYTANSGYAFSAWNVYKDGDQTTTINVENNAFTMPAYDVIVSATFVEVTTYSLVTNVSQIVSGKHYIIVGKKNNVVKAMGYDKGNNRYAVEVTETNSTISETDGVYEFVINGPIVIEETNYYTIYDTNENSTGYLYAAGGNSNNYLKTQATNDNKGQWTIEINSTTYVATIRANVSGRNLMQYNSSSTIFSCYAGTQDGLYLYVKVNDNDLEYYGSEITYAESSIPDGGSITVGAGSVVTVSNTFTNGNAAALVIEEGGQLIHPTAVNATLQKEISAYTAKSGDGWYMIASPVDNYSTDTLASGTYDLFAYNEATAYWWSNTGSHPFNTLSRGQGYLYANAADIDLSFAGEMIGTDDNTSVDLSYTANPDPNHDLKGFNLVGNPFTRNLVLGDMKLGGTPLTTFYVVNDAHTALQTITSDAYAIKPGEGFFVQATTTGQQLVFNPSSKDAFEFKYIKIVAGNDNGYDNAYIQLENGNTLRKMDIANRSNVYVIDNGDDYAATTIYELAGTMPVNFEAVEDGTYTITVEAKFIEAHSMHLIDNFTGADIDLMVEPSYTFNATANDNAERFTLVFDFNNYTGCNENYTSENFIYQSGDEIIVNGEGELKVFDVLGRFVMSQNVSGVERINKPAQTGVYIFMMNGNAQKIVVK